MSPLVTETSLTWWPSFAHLAAEPPALYCASSGWSAQELDDAQLAVAFSAGQAARDCQRPKTIATHSPEAKGDVAEEKVHVRVKPEWVQSD